MRISRQAGSREAEASPGSQNLLARKSLQMTVMGNVLLGKPPRGPLRLHVFTV